MDRDFLIDLFSDFGPVTIRRMFSGFGISADGTNFALALRGGLYFRADEQTIPRFEAEGSKPFQYQTRAKTVTVGSYWQLPERLYDDPEQLTGWARAAFAAAQRAALRKAPKATAKKKLVSKKMKLVSKKNTTSRVVPAKRSSRARRDLVAEGICHAAITRVYGVCVPAFAATTRGCFFFRRPDCGSRRCIPGRLRK
jgi:DNA transformation protein and related proteins